jgi:hypothetical protein
MPCAYQCRERALHTNHVDELRLVQLEGAYKMVRLLFALTNTYSTHFCCKTQLTIYTEHLCAELAGCTETITCRI